MDESDQLFCIIGKMYVQIVQQDKTIKQLHKALEKKQSMKEISPDESSESSTARSSS